MHVAGQKKKKSGIKDWCSTYWDWLNQDDHKPRSDPNGEAHQSLDEPVTFNISIYIRQGKIVERVRVFCYLFPISVFNRRMYYVTENGLPSRTLTANRKKQKWIPNTNRWSCNAMHCTSPSKPAPLYCTYHLLLKGIKGLVHKVSAAS